jgi:YVTN family beta-propeller protein
VLTAGALLAALGVVGTAAPAHASVTTVAYVPNQVDGTVSVISTATNTVTATIGVGFDPGAVAVSRTAPRSTSPTKATAPSR